MLLAAAFISYAGPFTNKVRVNLIKEFIKFLTDRGTPMTAGITGIWSPLLLCHPRQTAPVFWKVSLEPGLGSKSQQGEQYSLSCLSNQPSQFLPWVCMQQW